MFSNTDDMLRCLRVSRLSRLSSHISLVVETVERNAAPSLNWAASAQDRSVLAAGFDELGAEGQVRDEVAVHDIELDTIDARVLFSFSAFISFMFFFTF